MTRTPPDPDALADLLRQAGSGDSAALGELLQRYERRVRLTARSLLGPALRHQLDSLDLVQSVHRALLPGLRDGRYAFADEDQLVALAVTVLRHKVRRAGRRRQSPMEPGASARPAWGPTRQHFGRPRPPQTAPRHPECGGSATRGNAASAV